LVAPLQEIDYDSGGFDSTNEVTEMQERLLRRTSLFAILLCFTATIAAAQFDTGSVVGTVRDGTGAVVPGATVTLTNTATGISTKKTTDGTGNYEFFTVRPGVYVVTAE
jgi:carboxypeptidase family protein